MVCFKIHFHSMDDIIDFVYLCNKLDCQADLVCGKYTVNAKSILGICSVDLSKTLNLNVHTENEEQVRLTLKSYVT